MFFVECSTQRVDPPTYLRDALDSGQLDTLETFRFAVDHKGVSPIFSMSERFEPVVVETAVVIPDNTAHDTIIGIVRFVLNAHDIVNDALDCHFLSPVLLYRHSTRST